METIFDDFTEINCNAASSPERCGFPLLLSLSFRQIKTPISSIDFMNLCSGSGSLSLNTASVLISASNYCNLIFLLSNRNFRFKAFYVFAHSVFFFFNWTFSYCNSCYILFVPFSMINMSFSAMVL